MPSSLSLLDPAQRNFTMICTLVVLVCYCSSAYMQEKIFLVPGFTFGFYLTFIEFVVNASLAMLIHQINLHWPGSPFSLVEGSKYFENRSRRNGTIINNSNVIEVISEESNDIRSSSHRGQGRGVPFYYYFLLGICAVVSMGCSNTSLTYVSYPTKIVVKASKVVLIMVSHPSSLFKLQLYSFQLQ